MGYLKQIWSKENNIENKENAITRHRLGSKPELSDLSLNEDNNVKPKREYICLSGFVKSLLIIWRSWWQCWSTTTVIVGVIKIFLFRTWIRSVRYCKRNGQIRPMKSYKLKKHIITRLYIISSLAHEYFIILKTCHQ